MSIATDSLAGSLQTLVDARLDTIDRMLLGRVDRRDRLAIVREVEGQIHDLLRERPGGELDRDDVLAVLARLDPPEAYLPDEATDGPGPASTRTAGPSRIRPLGPTRPGPTDRGQFALAGGILGMGSLGLVLFSIMTFFGDAAWPAGLGKFLIFGSIGLTFVVGLLAIILSGYARLRGAWSVVGLVCGIISALSALSGFAFVLYNPKQSDLPGMMLTSALSGFAFVLYN